VNDPRQLTRVCLCGLVRFGSGRNKLVKLLIRSRNSSGRFVWSLVLCIVYIMGFVYALIDWMYELFIPQHLPPGVRSQSLESSPESELESQFFKLWSLESHKKLVLLRWQEFATPSVAVFFWHATAVPVAVANIGRSVSRLGLLTGNRWLPDQIVPAVLECANCSRHTTVEGALSVPAVVCGKRTPTRGREVWLTGLICRAFTWDQMKLDQMTPHLDDYHCSAEMRGSFQETAPRSAIIIATTVICCLKYPE